jgi:hypothetical protein
MYKYLTIFILIILFYTINKIIFINKINEKFENIDLNIGNYLVVYFYLMCKTFLQGKDFYYKHKNYKFINDLPSYIPLNKTIQNELIKNNFTLEELIIEEKRIILVGMWTILNKRREQLWLIMKPLINEILDNAFKKNNLKKEINVPVIHFRCSDTPFNRNEYYFFQKYKFFKDSLDDIKEMTKVNYKKVKLLSCNFHKSNDKNSKTCNVYASSLKEYLENIGYEIDIQCDSNIDDLATIFYAPAIISTSSSFSFIGGFFSNGIFISEGHYNCSKKNEKCNDCGKWLKKNYSIDHIDVEDYYDTSNVIKLLQA